MSQNKSLETFPWHSFQSSAPDCEGFEFVSDRAILDFFMKARIRQLKEFYDFDLSTDAYRRNFGWTVGKHEISYLRPVLPNETFTIRSRLLVVDSTTMLLESLLLDEKQNMLLALLWTHYHPIHLPTKGIAEHSETVRHYFAQRVVDVPRAERTSFDQRVEKLKDRSSF